MSGDKLQRMIAGWTPERLGEFMEYKYRLMTEEPGHICTPGKSRSHAPFYDMEYPYRDRIGWLDKEPWPTLMRTDPRTLIHPDPFELSALRKSSDGTLCYRVWDSVIAVPACGLRSYMIRNLSRIPVVRNINSHWTTTVRESLGHIGPLGPHGRVLRPTGPFVLDFTAMGEFGWTLREAVHVLAHLRGDVKPERTWIRDRNKVGWHNNAAAVELAYGLLFDVPIDVTNKERGRKGEPDTYYNVELKSTTYLRAPVMRLPWLGGETLRVDETLAVMLGGVFIEPVPYGFLASTSEHRPEDRWAGGPSLVALVGWETVDYLTHMPLGRFMRNPNSPVDYAIRGEALLPPETHWAYLALAVQRRGLPKTDSRWRYVRDWLNSPEYLRLRAQTPGLPCPNCYLVNSATDGAPIRPPSDHPEGARKSWPKAWQDYYDEIDRCIQLGQKAVDDYEPLYYSIVQHPKLPAQARKAAHTRKTKAIKRNHSDQRELERAIRKTKGQASGPMTARQRTLYTQYEWEQQNERTRLANLRG